MFSYKTLFVVLFSVIFFDDYFIRRGDGGRSVGRHE